MYRIKDDLPNKSASARVYMLKERPMEGKYMKKLMIGIMMLASVLTFAACNASASEVFASNDDVMAFQAISAVELLSEQNQPVTAVAKDLSAVLLEETTDEPIVADEIDVLDKYLTMMEVYLGNSDGLEVTASVSDNPDYTNMVTFTAQTLSGIEATYILYFNEVLFEETPIVDDETTTTTTVTTEAETTTEEETTTETDTTTPLGYKDQEQDRMQDKEFHFDDEGDENILYALSGMLVIGENNYLLEGKKIVEDDEEILIMRAWIDHENFVKVRYQNEENQKKFFFEIVEDGVIINKSKIRVQTEDGRVMTKLEFVEGAARGKYEFRTETIENITYIKIKYDVENVDGTEERGLIHIVATYDEVTGETTYEYQVRPDQADHNYEYNYEHKEHRDADRGNQNPGMHN